MRRRLVEQPLADRPLLRPRDFLEAAAVFALVVIATFPVVIPFLLVDDTARAYLASQVVTLVMLFLAGAALGRYAGLRRPFLTGIVMTVFGRRADRGGEGAGWIGAVGAGARARLRQDCRRCRFRLRSTR